MSSLTFILNGRPVAVADFHSDTTVLEHLRARGLVGTKEGCGDGDCGACTIAAIGTGPDGEPQYRAVNSCILPLGELHGLEVVTVEGLARGDALHPVQWAMVETGGSQCGYCTPGFIMSLFAGYYGAGLGDEALEGNLCRCTGYLPIRRAMARLEAPSADDPFLGRLRSRESEGLSVVSHQVSGVTDNRKPITDNLTSPLASRLAPAGRYFLPETLTEVFDLLDAHPEAVLVAGGTDVGLELSHKRLLEPVLVGLGRVPELHALNVSDERAVIGAGLPLEHLERRLAGVFPALDEMLHWFAARQIKNRATLGGNLGTASPIGDLSPVWLALDAAVTLANRAGERDVPIADYFTGYRQTVRLKDEIIVSVTVPRALPEGAARRESLSYKVSKRAADDISTVAATFTLDLDASGRIVRARLAYGGVAATPVRAVAVEDWLAGRPWDERTVRGALPMLEAAFTPLDDVRASAAYRRAITANLFHKFFHERAGVSA